ncbi:amidohydrolase family protein [Roseobacteraceae bacterium NS-SX3]
MPGIRITNCHIHTFTAQHVPRDFPARWARIFRREPALILWAARLFALLGQERRADELRRLHRFQKQGAHGTQAKILEDVKKHYPPGTRFVVLPMDMAGMDCGPVPVSLREQHDELAELRYAADPADTVIPFATLDPRVPGHAQECLRAIRDLGFAGLKIYPQLGFPPDHPVLMEQIYPEIADRGLPVMAHCSRGGVQGRLTDNYSADLYTRPKAYEWVLSAFPEMRVCLAHFGGLPDWHAYANATGTRNGENWMLDIREMIGSGDYPNLWTDISYTMFRFSDYAPILRLLLKGEDLPAQRLRARVLFGSDFYMTRLEELSERAVSIRLRDTLGEELFRQIAETNPGLWLGGQGA